MIVLSETRFQLPEDMEGTTVSSMKELGFTIDGDTATVPDGWRCEAGSRKLAMLFDANDVARGHARHNYVSLYCRFELQLQPLEAPDSRLQVISYVFDHQTATECHRRVTYPRRGDSFPYGPLWATEARANQKGVKWLSKKLPDWRQETAYWGEEIKLVESLISRIIHG